MSIVKFCSPHTSPRLMTTDGSPFVQALVHEPAFSAAASALWSGQSISAEGAVGSSIALTAAALFQSVTGTMILVTADAETAEKIAEDLTVFLSAEQSEPLQNVLLFPPMEQRDDDSESALVVAGEAFGERIHVLKQLLDRAKQRLMLVISMSALLQAVPPPRLLKERTQILTVNSKVDLDALRAFLVEGGYHAVPAVDLPGEFAVRGYILDLFAPDWERPVRIEFFHDEIESIRRFDLTTQRSLETMTEIDITRLQPHECVGAAVLDYFPNTVPMILLEPHRFAHQE